MMVFTRNGLFAVLFAAITLSLFFACSKPTLIGSDLLEQDQINVGFTDTATLLAYTRLGDSTRTYDPATGNQLVQYYCGRYRDPIFGLSEATPNFEVRLNTIPPDFEGAVLDSMVLILPWSEDPSYGNLNTIYDLQVLTLAENMNNDAQYFSNVTFGTERLIGQLFFQPNPEDSLVVRVHGADDPDTFDTIAPQVRIPIYNGFAEEFINQDPSVFLTDSSFLAQYPGLQIRTGAEYPGILGFDLTSTNAGLRLYYHVDTLALQYLFPLQSSSARMVSFEHDYSGTKLEDFLENKELGDSLLFLQGMAGVSPVFEIPYPDAFQGQLINRAELEITVLTLPGDDESFYPPIDRILVAEIAEDSSLVVIPDVLIALDRDNLADYDFLFGGFPTDDTPQKYKLNITAHFQEMRDGLRTNRILLTGLTRAQQPSRVVICGPDHPDYPAKLNISFTSF